MVKHFPARSWAIVPVRKLKAGEIKEAKYAPGMAAMKRREHSGQQRVHMRKGLVTELSQSSPGYRLHHKL